MESEWQKYKKEVLKSAKPWDILNPSIKKVDKEISNLRLNICKECPEFIKITKTCKKCGCFMKEKTKLPHASCPLQKWLQVEESI